MLGVNLERNIQIYVYFYLFLFIIYIRAMYDVLGPVSI